MMMWSIGSRLFWQQPLSKAFPSLFFVTVNKVIIFPTALFWWIFEGSGAELKHVVVHPLYCLYLSSPAEK